MTIPVPLVVYTSRTGNTRTFVDYLVENIDPIVTNNIDVNIADFETIVIGSHTWRNGKIPSDMKDFLIRNKDNFKGKRVFIFGSGLSIYQNFCGAVDNIRTIVRECGAEVIGTFKFEQRFIESEFDKKELNNMLKKIG